MAAQKHSRTEPVGRAEPSLWVSVVGSGAGARCAAIGDGGNILYVSPEKNLVAAITSRFQPRVKDRIEFIRKYVEPVFA